MDFIFYLTLFCLILVLGGFQNSIDFDFWARLIVGKSFFQTTTLFNQDFHSWGATHGFVDHEWGSSLVFYLIQNYLGDIGITVFKCIIIFLTFFIVTKIIRLEDKNSKFHFLFFFFVLHSMSSGAFNTIRCHTFSFLFFALYIYILKYAKVKNNYRVLWCLPALNIIWANMHGGFALGLIIIAIFSFGEYLNKNKFWKYYLIAFVVSCLTTIINPYGIRYLTFIYGALSLHRTHIMEWHSAFFEKKFLLFDLKFKLFFILSNLIFLSSIIKNLKTFGLKEFFAKIDKTKYLIILFTILISLKSMRFHVFFSYAVVIFCYNDFYNIFNKKLPEFLDNTKEIVFCAFVFLSSLYSVSQGNLITTVSNKEYPIYACEFIKINNLKGNLLSNFHHGSYLAYKLYPNIHVFMDGRYEEVYDINLINELAKLHLGKDEGEFFKKHHCDIFIFDKFYKEGYQKMKENKEWFIPYEDDDFAVFMPSKYKSKKFIEPTLNSDYYIKTKFETNISFL